MSGSTRRGVIGGIASAPFLAAAAQSTAPTLVSVAQFGAGGHNDLADGAAIQRALDEAPLGSDLVFPPGVYRVDRQLNVSRHVNLVGQGATILGDFGRNTGADLLAVNVVDGDHVDNRNQRIEGLNIGFVSGGRNTLAVTNQPPNVANIGMLIQNNLIGTLPASTGNAVRMEGIGTHFNTIRDCQIENGIYLAGADGMTVSGCLIFGFKVAVTVDVVAGAFQTRILDNGLVARDGALRLIGGSQVYFEHNQVEQFQAYGANQSARRASVWIEPSSYGARHVNIVGNNFGAGTNLQTSIFVAGDCQDLFIDHNVFNIAGGGIDITLADAAVQWTRIGPNNSLRGPAALRPHLGRGDPLAVDDRGTGTFGVRRPGAALALARGWIASPNFGFWKTLAGEIRWQGSLAGQARAGTVIGRLPAGFWPAAQTVLLCPLDGIAAIARIAVDEDGTLRAESDLAGTIALGAVAFTARLRDPYPASDP
jgi:Pectate lyase superfamily protein